MGTTQLCALRNDGSHCDVVRPCVFRLSIEVFQPLLGLVAAERDVKQLKQHIEWMPERARARIFLPCVSCQIEHTKKRRRNNISVTTCFTFGTKLGQMNWILLSSATIKMQVWFVAICIDFVPEVEEMVAALNLARSTDVKPMQKPISCQLSPTQVRSSTSVALFSGCGGARQNKTVFDKAAGEFTVRLVEIRAGIIMYSTEMFQPAKTLCTLGSRCGRCRRIDGETEVRVAFFSVQISKNVSSLQRGFTSSSQRHVVFIVRAPSILGTSKAKY